MMRRSRATRALMMLVCLGVSHEASAQTATVPIAPAPATAPQAPDKGVTLHGFVSASYVFNFNRPSSGSNTLRVFDLRHDAVTIDVAEAVIEKPVSQAGDAGFRMDFEAGSSIPRVSAAVGLFRDAATGQAHDYDLQQAYVSYMFSGRARIDAGKFVTPLGLEVIEGTDGFNDNASRSFLFGYAIPFTHTGVRVTMSGKAVSGLVMVANGWDSVTDNNSGKTVAGQLTLKPTATTSLAIAAITGPEQHANSHNLRTVYDLAATWNVTPRSSLSLSADDGRESGVTPAGGNATWRGAAAYGRIGVSKRFAICLRGELFDDPQGVRTGTGQRLTEFTVTPEWTLSSHALVRADFRLDRSNQPVFERPSGSTRTQPTVQGNFILHF